MRRAPSLILKALVLVYGVIVSSGAIAAGESSKRPSNSFNLVVPAPAGANAVVLPTNGVGIAPSKAVMMDPYKVPLIQNAGSLTSSR